MASIRMDASGPARVRLHRAFGTAPESVLLALAHYLSHRRRKDWATILDFAHSIPADPAGRKPEPARPAGCLYDLRQMMNDINAEHFENQLQCSITWGRHGVRRKRRRRSIRYGSYDREHRRITIHPALDSSEVPEEFVRYIVFHEMLHDAIPSRKVNGRVYHHPPEFTAREKQYPEYERMKRLSGTLMQKL